MCGRFDLDQSNREIDRLVAGLPPNSHPIKYGEVFPSNHALTLVLRDEAPAPESLAWGLPRWDGKGVLINARAESALQKPAFRKNLLAWPIAIPTTGFYEWRADPATGRKQKYRFTDPASPILWLAGFRGFFPKEAEPNRFTILTTGANGSVMPFHTRMPALLRESELEAWLRGKNREEILSREPFMLASAPA